MLEARRRYVIKPYQRQRKIAIIGCAGSGKTTLALELKKKLNLPLYHLDQYYWKPGWQRGDLETFSKIHDALCEQDEWIIEGSYLKLLYKRVLHADVVIFLDVPRYKCLWYVLKRAVLNWGTVIPGNPQQCEQRLFSFEFLRFLNWVWNFNKKHREQVMRILEEFKGKKQIYRVKSLGEVRAALALEQFFNN
jgi:adenylate kinase family enzyme